jgi:hypothetical protein
MGIFGRDPLQPHGPIFKRRVIDTYVRTVLLLLWRRNCEQNKVGFRGVVKRGELGIFVEREVYCVVMGLPTLCWLDL